MKNIFVILLLFIFSSCGQKNPEFKGKTVSFSSEDGLTITADLYLLEDRSAPLILLFHQAGFSRGEYRSIAPRLNKLGFSCMAIDQRSGKEVNGVTNETNQQATKSNKKVEYINALPDMQAAIQYASTELKNDNIILWGSSYSASLALYLATQYKVAGVLAFSPGEYFRIDGKPMKAHTTNIKCPVFITSSKTEAGKWAELYEAVSAPKVSFLPATKGNHGSKALWPGNEGHEEYWKAVEQFLKDI